MRHAALLLLSSLLLSCVAHARPGPRPQRGDGALTLEAAGVPPRAFRALGDPVLLDRAAARQVVTGLTAELATLDRMLELVRDRRERKALKGQLEATRAKLEALEAALQSAPPLQRAQRRQVEKHIVVTEAPPPSEPPLEPATGAQMARIQQSLHDASFRDDKLRVIRAAAREHHFSTAQARTLTEALAFGKDRVEVLALLHPRLIDPENFHTLFSLLPHGSDRAALEKRLGL